TRQSKMSASLARLANQSPASLLISARSVGPSDGGGETGTCYASPASGSGPAGPSACLVRNSYLDRKTKSLPGAGIEPEFSPAISWHGRSHPPTHALSSPTASPRPLRISCNRRATGRHSYHERNVSINLR